MSNGLHIYLQWLRDRLRSSVVWTLGLVLTIVATAAFYPSLAETHRQPPSRTAAGP